MVKHRHSRSCGRSCRNKRSRGVKRGGSSNYTSASTYGSYVNGSVDSQYARVFDQSGSSNPSNISIGVQGQNAGLVGSPTPQHLTFVQSAGKRTRTRRGGVIGEVVSQAIVPFSLLALQQSYRKKRGGKSRRTRKHKHKY